MEGNSTTLKNWIQKLEGKPTTLKNWIKKMEGNSTTPKNCVLTNFLHERSTIFFLVFSLIRFWIFVRNVDCQWRFGWSIPFFVLVDPYPFIILFDPYPCIAIKGYGSTKTSLTVNAVWHYWQFLCSTLCSIYLRSLAFL